MRAEGLDRRRGAGVRLILTPLVFLALLWEPDSRTSRIIIYALVALVSGICS